MSGTNPVFLVRRAKKQSGNKDAVLWCSDDFEAANATLDYLLIKTGAKLKDYFKAVATNFPVVNELPPEGELSLTFCDYYQLAKDNMTWTQIPGVTLPSSEAAAAARQHIVDGVDTETGEVLEDHTENFGNKSNSPAQATAPAPELTVVATMPLRHRVLAQYIGEGEYLYHVDASQKKEILRLEMDTDNSYVQNLLLAAENVEAFKKAIEHDIHKIVNAVKKVFPVDGKTPELATVIQFLKTWFETEHIDRGLLVKEWAKGNRVSAIQRTESGANAGGGNKTDRNPDYEHTLDTLDVEIAMATLPMDFNIYELPGSVYRRAKEIVKKKESPFKEWSAALRATPGILDYSRAAIFALIRSAHPEFYHYPGRLQGYINANLTETDHENPTEEALTAARHTPEKDAVEEANRQLAAARGEYVEGISDPNDPKWVKTETSQPTTEPELVKNVGNGIFDVSALMQNSSTHGTETNPETTSNVQVQKADSDEKQAGDAVQAGEGDLGTGKEAVTVEAETHQNNDSVSQSEPEAQQNVPETQQEEPQAAWPEYFEPGRYEGVPNEVYHAANGISSTQVKDARVSLMYYEGLHVSKTISRQDNPAFIFGRATHSFVLEPGKFSEDYALPEKMPEDVVSTAGDMVALIKEYNANLPALMTPEELKAWIEEYNSNLTPPLPLNASADEIANSYMSLPEEFQRIPDEAKPTATAMKACIKECNSSLEPMLKTSGTRDQLLDQIATVAPEFAEQERAKFIPYNISGTKEQLAEIVRAICPDVVFADDWHKQQEAANAGKEMISNEMYGLIKNINDALQANKDASRLLNHPARQSEVSYFGLDEETGLEVRVRPDIEIRLPYESICADLKTVSLGYVRQDKLKDRLHREIIDRDYHLSAAMYCDIAGLDKFTWIFVNKDPGYHWVVVVDASPMLLELGRKEYRRALRQIEEAMETGYWPAPITETYTDELNDYDTRRLEALGAE
ncbi:PD-(D/E)XK nuclease-like domain-containing protein [Salmonella enterica]|uniref:RecE family exodeoxyribonuclease n=1 Tax=Salmonella enterica TaxID=28901 RepID=UPI001494FCF7|nr:RecE family exodeoxyribonuclease [Salmonella enterica]EDU6438635.1 exodeoxyribonuclease [Salmonella enterica subsp. salamae serovar 47:b:e,n,x,z15]EHK2381556.1 PD-(D/E)XK nuclease-like domain-containing protein [Salmonella enterica]EIS9091786.1 PD-(D/E)XK nuclease-like domain-containing protein [Salmonella enterica]EIT5539031.1 PD-(D/E)XK nuclease-like domain-containing protein [Salmonella enterica]EIY5602607.1 PD-(D/E)XK nuclease-like domain-containing protein [Salmonella enterica]